MAILSPQSKAPDFTLPDQNGKDHSLSDFHGSWVLVYFYPKDDTPGCTKEACAIRDNFPDFKKLQITVLGISADTVAKHKKFADKYDLPFILLSDTEKTVIKQYGAWGKKKFMGRQYDGIFRISFLINPKRKIEKVYEKVDPATHAQEVLQDIQSL